MHNTSIPPFLNLLDSDPDTAFAEFYRWAIKTLTNVPPKPMGSLNREEREDLIQDIIYHCLRDNCRALRQYDYKGKSFSAWVYVIAHNKCIDFLRRKNRETEVFLNYTNNDDIKLEKRISHFNNRNENNYDRREILTIVREMIAKLSEHCRLLLEMAADDFKPREMAAALGLAKDKNKKVSDDLRECRRKLKKSLSKSGIDIGIIMQA